MTKTKQLTVKAFKELVRDDNLPPRVALAKGLVSSVRSIGDPRDRTLAFVASTGDVDRDGDTIDPKGWELDNFRKGGSILWAHDPSQPPIASPTKIWAADGALKMHARFSSQFEFADLVYRLFQEGTLKGVSVGFAPIDFVVSDRNDGKSMLPPLDFKKQELLEVSATPVPSNPHALVEAAKSFNCKSLVDWTEQKLDGEGSPSIWIPEDLIEVTHKALTGNKVVVDLSLKGSSLTSAANGHTHALSFDDGPITGGTPLTTDEVDGHTHLYVTPERLEPGMSATMSSTLGGDNPHTHVATVTATVPSKDSDLIEIKGADDTIEPPDADDFAADESLFDTWELDEEDEEYWGDESEDKDDGEEVEEVEDEEDLLVAARALEEATTKGLSKLAQLAKALERAQLTEEDKEAIRSVATSLLALAGDTKENKDSTDSDLYEVDAEDIEDALNTLITQIGSKVTQITGRVL